MLSEGIGTSPFIYSDDCLADMEWFEGAAGRGLAVLVSYQHYVLLPGILRFAELVSFLLDVG